MEMDGQMEGIHEMRLRRGPHPGDRRALGARITGDRQPLRLRKVLIEPIENCSKLFLFLNLQDVRPPQRVGGLDHAAPMTKGRMPVARHEPDEVAILHDRRQSGQILQSLSCCERGQRPLPRVLACWPIGPRLAMRFRTALRQIRDLLARRGR
jgi:hypothetical protein